MSSEQIIIFVVLPVAAYFLGSIPFAFVIGKAHGVDIRTVGSKNVGATNLGRALGIRYFWQAFFLDGAKGFVPVLAAALLVRYFNQKGVYVTGQEWTPLDLFRARTLRPVMGVHQILLPNWTPLLSGAACIVGHLFPVWLKFKGGKGVATAFGVVLGFWPLYTLAGLGAGAFFVVMLMIYRYISLASMTSSVVFVLTVAWLGGWENPYVHTWLPVDTYLPWPQRWPLIVVAGLFSLLIIVRHRGNIVRLMKGTEPKVGMGRNSK